MNGLLLKIKQLLRDKKKTDILLYVLIVGVFLFLLSLTMPKTKVEEEKTKENGDGVANTPTQGASNLQQSDLSESYVDWLEKRLENTLEKMEGIGNVTVMITLSSSKEVCFLKDIIREETTVTENQGNGTDLSQSIQSQELVVVIDKGDGSQQVYVTKEYMPEVEGVLILAQGADEKKSFEITEAVQALFSVASHKIKVLKMGAE